MQKTLNQSKIDSFFEAIEDMMDIHTEIVNEYRYDNVWYVESIKKERLYPARDKAKKILVDILSDK